MNQKTENVILIAVALLLLATVGIAAVAILTSEPRCEELTITRMDERIYFDNGYSFKIENPGDFKVGDDITLFTKRTWIPYLDGLVIIDPPRIQHRFVIRCADVRNISHTFIYISSEPATHD